MAVSTVNLPTLYEYYTAGGINSGLSVNQPHFTLNDKNISLYSGAMHYFRVPKEYWRDRLRKMRAAGLNTVETYVPWNLHEPQPGAFDFGDGGSDMQEFLDIRQFLKIAQEEDLLTIVRPGPYICSEWEFGGLPSWLLREQGVKVRTSDSNYMKHVTRYFNALLPILALFQFTKGGSLIALQLENEYASTYQPGSFTPDKVYLEQLRQLMLKNGIQELLFTSDAAGYGTIGTLPDKLFLTANFASGPETEFDKLKSMQPGKPVMAMEWWTGWFDHWSEDHHTLSSAQFRDIYERILKYPASVNMYMFHGGTNWGFLNGANIADSGTNNKGFQPDTTSYDYDAPLSEAGDYTEKYVIVKELIAKYETVKTKLPEAPAVDVRQPYPNMTITAQLLLNEIINNVPTQFRSADVVAMEYLPMNNNSGQSYGYIIYRKEHLNITADSILKIGGHICDTVVVLVNGVLMSKPLTKSSDLDGFGFWRIKDSTLNLGSRNLTDATLELVVENWGRNNFGRIEQFNQFKGIWQGGVYINNEQLKDWHLVPLEFKKSWTNNLKGWHEPQRTWLPGPALYKTSFTIQKPHDTFIDMREWTKGIVTINGFVLGRYARIGPQQTLYLPAPLVKQGVNDIVIFEHYTPASKVVFSADPIFQTIKST